MNSNTHNACLPLRPSRRYAAWGILIALSLCGCSGGGSGPTTTTPTGPTQLFDFNAGTLGWTSDASDLPANYDNQSFEISFSRAQLPAPLDTSKKALRLTSHNRSDDLWQFVRRRVGGLSANTLYQLRFDVEIASDAPEDSVGVGGSPGASVVVKAGASAQEPTVKIEGGERVFSLDKGNQSVGGSEAYVLGSVGIAGDEFVYTLKSLSNASRPFPVRTDN
ncbi:MAG TPA: hypothetical protein VF627_12555, partial [Abditibacterium sp.]